MLDFKELTVKAMADVRPLLEFQEFRSCDYSVGGMHMWRDHFRLLYCIKGDMLFWTSDYMDKGVSYGVPVGPGSLEAAVGEIRRDAAERHIPVRFCTVPGGSVGRLSELVGRPSENAVYREWADYLYPYSNFLGYHGKKLVTQRNHCNRFMREYPRYEYLALTPELAKEAKSFLVENRAHFMKDAPIAREDLIRSIEAFGLFSELGYSGGMLRVDGKTIGVTLGETIRDTLYVHVEKALSGYSGAYPMLARLYAEQMARDGLLYINREDDSDDPGLRWSKTEYRPITLIEKYTMDFGPEV